MCQMFTDKYTFLAQKLLYKQTCYIFNTVYKFIQQLLKPMLHLGQHFLQENDGNIEVYSNVSVMLSSKSLVVTSGIMLN